MSSGIAPPPYDRDEFEDLLVGTPSTRALPGGAKGRRGLAAVLALAMLGILVLGLAWALSRPAPGSDVAPADPVPADPVPPAADQPTPTPTTEPDPATAATDPSSRDWPVPPSAKHGPAQWRPTQASGFSRTDRGAALAAANIAARLDPYRGPATYQPTLARQTVGVSDELAAEVDAAYRRVVTSMKIRYGDPVPPEGSPVATFAGWRATGCRDSCSVHLLAEWPEGPVVFEASVVWRDGDWRVRPNTTSAFFTNIGPGDPAQFHRFGR